MTHKPINKNVLPYDQIEYTVQIFQKHQLISEAGWFLLKQYQILHPGFKGFEYREEAQPTNIVMTTEGNFKQPQIIRIPSNAFTFPLPLIVNLLAHEMLHVKQKTETLISDKNEREWQAYYETIFHNEYPLVPQLSNFYVKHFINQAFRYYDRMGENSELQIKYEAQKHQLTQLLNTIQNETPQNNKTP